MGKTFKTFLFISAFKIYKKKKSTRKIKEGRIIDQFEKFQPDNEPIFLIKCQGFSPKPFDRAFYASSDIQEVVKSKKSYFFCSINRYGVFFFSVDECVVVRVLIKSVCAMYSLLEKC